MKTICEVCGANLELRGFDKEMGWRKYFCPDCKKLVFEDL